MAALSVENARRLRNWARSNAGMVPGVVRAIDYGATPTSGYAEAVMPTLHGEAHDTEVALSLVQLRYQPAVRQFWGREGLSLRSHAKVMARVGVDHRVFERWVLIGHDQFAGHAARLTLIWRAIAERNRFRSAAAFGD